MICHQPRRTGAEPGSAAQPRWALSSLPSLRPRSSQEGSKSFSCSQINTFKGFLLGLGGHCWGWVGKDGPRTTQQRNELDLSPFPGIFPFPAAFPQSSGMLFQFPERREERGEVTDPSHNSWNFRSFLLGKSLSSFPKVSCLGSDFFFCSRTKPVDFGLDHTEDAKRQRKFPTRPCSAAPCSTPSAK